jgi:hypothetical protein
VQAVRIREFSGYLKEPSRGLSWDPSQSFMAVQTPVFGALIPLVVPLSFNTFGRALEL